MSCGRRRHFSVRPGSETGRVRRSIEEQIEALDLTVSGDDEVGSGVGWILSWYTSYPSHPTRTVMKDLSVSQGHVTEAWMHGTEPATRTIASRP